MSDNWAERERHTHRLISAIADHVLKQRTVTADQVYGMCRLTWITKGYDREDAPYIRSTKLPALADIFGDGIDTGSLEKAAHDVASVLGIPKAVNWVKEETGFTTFYPAYRNSALTWLEVNRDAVVHLVRATRRLKTDKEAESLAKKLEDLPLIPKANHPESGMSPQFLLTPLLFSLDPRLRFPNINGRAAVQNLLRMMKVKDADLGVQLRAMVGLLDSPGIKDAADLDSASEGGYLHEIYVAPGEKPKVSRLTTKPAEGKNLPLKDEADHLAIQTGITQPKRRLHNRMTNRLKVLLADYNLLEGEERSALYDVLVKAYDGEEDLLIEIKSSEEEPHVRMAIGQLCAYAYHLRPNEELATAVLLPTEPNRRVKQLMEWLEIGCIWFTRDDLETLATSSPWVEHLTQERTSRKKVRH